MKTTTLKKESDWKDHLDAQQASTLSKYSYCKQHGISYTQFMYRFRKRNKVSRPFIPIQRKAANPVMGLCTIELSQGHRLVIHDDVLLPKLKHIVESLS